MLIAEELILLALDNDTGKFASSTTGYGGYAIAGAILMDLIFAHKLELGGKKGKVVMLADDSPHPDPVLNELFKEIKKSKRPKKLEDWINALESFSYRTIQALLHRLTEQGILKKEERRILKVFHVVRRPIVNPDLKNKLLSDIQAVMLEEIQPEEHMVGLLSLIKTANLIPSLFVKEVRKKFEKKINALIKSEKIGRAVMDLINAINGAMVAVIVATTSSY